MKPLTCLLALLLALGRGAVAADAPFPMQARRIADGVYAVITPVRGFPNPENRGWNSNSAFVVTGDGVLLFDTGSSEAIGRALRTEIAKVTDRPVRWIVNSHEHGDHWLGNHAFADLEPEIIATPHVAAKISSDGPGWIRNFDRMNEGATAPTTIAAPDSLVDARSERRLGGVSVVLIPTRSHSPGDLMVWLPEQRVLLAGDVVYAGRMPSLFSSDARGWIAELEVLQRLEPEAVVPGHGEPTDRAGLRRLRELLQAFWNAVEAGYEAGKSDYEMVPEVIAALAPFADAFPGMDEKVGRDISHLFLQVEAAVFE